MHGVLCHPPEAIAPRYAASRTGSSVLSHHSRSAELPEPHTVSGSYVMDWLVLWLYNNILVNLLLKILFGYMENVDLKQHTPDLGEIVKTFLLPCWASEMQSGERWNRYFLVYGYRNCTDCATVYHKKKKRVIFHQYLFSHISSKAFNVNIGK